MDKKQLVCIVCPKGCSLTIIKDEISEKSYKVFGNSCKRGEEYGINELFNPTRVLTTTVRLRDSFLKRIPVKTETAIPKDKIMQCMDVINKIYVIPTVKIGQIIIANILDTGVNLISCRNIEE